MTMTSIHIIKTNGSAAPGKLADAENHLTGGELDGLKLVGFAVRKSRDGRGQNISGPSRHFTIGGDKRSFSFVRWVEAPEALRRLEIRCAGSVSPGPRHERPRRSWRAVAQLVSLVSTSPDLQEGHHARERATRTF